MAKGTVRNKCSDDTRKLLHCTYHTSRNQFKSQPRTTDEGQGMKSFTVDWTDRQTVSQPDSELQSIVRQQVHFTWRNLHPENAECGQSFRVTAFNQGARSLDALLYLLLCESLPPCNSFFSTELFSFCTEHFDECTWSYSCIRGLHASRRMNAGCPKWVTECPSELLVEKEFVQSPSQRFNCFSISTKQHVPLLCGA